MGFFDNILQISSNAGANLGIQDLSKKALTVASDAGAGFRNTLGYGNKYNINQYQAGQIGATVAQIIVPSGIVGGAVIKGGAVALKNAKTVSSIMTPLRLSAVESGATAAASTAKTTSILGGLGSTKNLLIAGGAGAVGGYLLSGSGGKKEASQNQQQAPQNINPTIVPNQIVQPVVVQPNVNTTTYNQNQYDYSLNTITDSPYATINKKMSQDASNENNPAWDTPFDSRQPTNFDGSNSQAQDQGLTQADGLDLTKIAIIGAIAAIGYGYVSKGKVK